MALLIATLGTEAQVVTAALDLLLHRGERITQVKVLHTVETGGAVEKAVQRLAQEFSQPIYQRTFLIEFLPITNHQHNPIADVQSVEEIKAAYRFIYTQVRLAKANGDKVHFCIAGGRKTLAIFGMAVAQLLFDDQDALWHLHSGGDFLESKRLHPQPGDDVRLISIPFIHWSRVSPIFTDLAQIEDPFVAAERVRNLQLAEKLESIRGYLFGLLTPAEQRAVSLLVQQGLSDQEIADHLCLSPRTVEQQLRSAYIKAASHWELADVNRTQLVSLVNLFYSLSS